MSKFKYDPSWSTQMDSYDVSFSECSGSTATPKLRKLASLEFSPYIAHVNQKPAVIDLTDISHPDDLRLHVNDMRSRKNKKYVITVQDETTGKIADPFSSYTSHCSTSSSNRTAGSHKVYHDAGVLSTSSSRATFHQNEAYNTEKVIKPIARSIDTSGVTRRRARVAHDEITTVHHNGSNVLYATDTSKAQFVPIKQPKKGRSHPPKAHPQPQTMQALPKAPLTNTVQKKTFLSSVLQCVNPRVPGDEDTPIQSRSQLAAFKALRSDEDALDGFFNTVERLSCQDETELRRAVGELASTNNIGHQPHHLHDESSFASNSIILDAYKESRYDTVVQIADERDALDTLCEGVEKFACRDDVNTSSLKGKFLEKDTLDNVFEGVERICHHDDFASSTLKIITTRMKKRQDPSGVCASSRERRSQQHEANDMLEKFGMGFERALCTGQAARIGYEGDILDRVFEQQRPVDSTKHRNDAIHQRDRAYYEAPKYDRNLKKIVVASRDDDTKDWYYVGPRHDLPQNDSMRRPSCGNDQPQKNVRNETPPAGKDMLDYVFENVEAGVCRSVDHHHSRRTNPSNRADPIDDARRFYNR